jgi:F0F1-type ATP synthase assembly protein I
LPCPVGRPSIRRGIAAIIERDLTGVGPMAKPPEEDAYAAFRSSGLMLAIPTLLIVSPLAGFFLGVWLDRWFHTRPWLSIVGLALGFVAAGRETWLIYRRTLEADERQKKKEK